MVRVSDAKSDCSRRGEAEVRVINFKTTWSEFHNLSRFNPKQLFFIFSKYPNFPWVHILIFRDCLKSWKKVSMDFWNQLFVYITWKISCSRKDLDILQTERMLNDRTLVCHGPNGPRAFGQRKDKSSILSGGKELQKITNWPNRCMRNLLTKKF